MIVTEAVRAAILDQDHRKREEEAALRRAFEAQARSDDEHRARFERARAAAARRPFNLITITPENARV